MVRTKLVQEKPRKKVHRVESLTEEVDEKKSTWRPGT